MFALGFQKSEFKDFREDELKATWATPAIGRKIKSWVHN